MDPSPKIIVTVSRRQYRRQHLLLDCEYPDGVYTDCRPIRDVVRGYRTGEQLRFATAERGVVTVRFDNLAEKRR